MCVPFGWKESVVEGKNVHIGMNIFNFQTLKIFIEKHFFSHERPTDPDDPLADQNIKDRYYGVNDPVADKLLKRAAAMPALPPPEDITITTLYIGNLGTLNEAELR